MSKSSIHTEIYRQRSTILTSRSLEKVSLYACLYHVRPYHLRCHSSEINRLCLRRLLKSNYFCQFEESKEIAEHKILVNKSTFILGNFMLTVYMNQLNLYTIDQHRLVFVAEEICPVKIVFVGICTYTDFSSKFGSKRDGFILMTADQRLFLYDFKLKSRMDSKGISFQCEIPVKFLEKSFEYHEQNHFISIHTRYKQGAHLFVLFRIWPRWLSYVFLVERTIFGEDLKLAAVTHELLITQNQRNSCHLYSLSHLLDEFTIKSHSVADHPDEVLPINVVIHSRPPCLFTFSCDRPVFDYAFFSTHHFLTRIDEDYIVFHINDELVPVTNGHLKRLWTDNLSPNSQVYFLDTINNEDCIIDVREASIHVWRLKHENGLSNVEHLYHIDNGADSMSSPSNERHVTRYGRETVPQRVLDLTSTVLTDHYFDTFNNLLTLLFECEQSDTAIIRIIEHPHGISRQDIRFKKKNKNNQLKIAHEHEKLIVQELSCHTVILRIFYLQRQSKILSHHVD